MKHEDNSGSRAIHEQIAALGAKAGMTRETIVSIFGDGSSAAAASELRSWESALAQKRSSHSMTPEQIVQADAGIEALHIASKTRDVEHFAEISSPILKGLRSLRISADLSGDPGTLE